MSALYLEFDLDIEKFESELEKGFSPEDLEDIANRAVLMILSNTRAGVDGHKQPFKPYSAKYAKYRAKRGRGSTVDMLFTGVMLGAMQGRSQGDLAIVDFVNQSAGQIAEYHISAAPRSKMPLRDFLHLDESGEDMRTLAEMAAEMIARRLG